MEYAWAQIVAWAYRNFNLLVLLINAESLLV